MAAPDIGSSSNETGGHAAARFLAGWLGLAAAPTFAAMALFSIVSGSGACMAQDASPLSGMAAMYLLMSAFHLAPWLRVVGSRS
ncbi:MAG: hypothetical protein ACTHNH_05625 [Mesorhizobium sp.]